MQCMFIVKVRILNFERDLVVVWFIHIELMVSLISRVQKLNCYIYIYIYIYTLPLIYIQGVPGGMCQTSGGCSLC